MKASLLATFAIGFASQSALAASIAPFSLPLENGARSATYATADHPKAVFVLEFLANFCPACNDNATNVNALADVYKANADVQVLDVTLDTQQREINQWIANHSPNHPVVQDVGSAVYKQTGSAYIPTTVVMDCKGDVQFQAVGGWDDTETAQIKAAVDAAVKACAGI